MFTGIVEELGEVGIGELGRGEGAGDEKRPELHPRFGRGAGDLGIGADEDGREPRAEAARKAGPAGRGVDVVDAVGEPRRDERRGVRD